MMLWGYVSLAYMNWMKGNFINGLILKKTSRQLLFGTRSKGTVFLPAMT
jgi:hypothetical protein